MGVNNLLKYLKEAKIEVQNDVVPKEYNLSIDLATIVVPIMQVSSDHHDFVSRLRLYVLENRRFVALLLNACEVRGYLDMFSPRMKIDMLENRKRDKYVKMPMGNQLKPCRSQAMATRRLLGTEVKKTIALREVRNFIASTILNAMCEFDKTFEMRCSFDIYRIGEGEIKCMSYKGMCRPNLPNVILSNDNDVLLMILLHESYKNVNVLSGALPTAHYYRAMIHPRGRSNIKKSAGSDMIVHRFAVNTTASCGSLAGQIHTSACCRWILVVWIICLCGTDFVHPICMITQNRRKILLERCVIRFKRHQYPTQLCRQFSFDNFFIIMNILFDILMGDESAFYPADGTENRVLFVDNVPPMSKHMEARLDKVAKWCSRVYWNILYFIDLPIDFHRRDNRVFKSNTQIAVNTYIENTVISFWSLGHLTPLCRHALYGKIKRFCMQQDYDND